MPNRWSNWSFEEVSEFLELHGFIKLPPTRSLGSHFRWIHPDNNEAYAELQRHPKGFIPIKTLQSTARKSLVADEEWLKYSKDKKSYRKNNK